MYTLLPYRAGVSLPGLRRMPPRSPATNFAGILVVAMWIGIFLFVFPRMSGVSVFLLFVGAIVATVAIPAGIIFGWQALVNTRLGEPQLRVNTSRIQRGTELQCEFVQPVKGQVAISDARIQLVIHEWVQYTEGTNTRTQTHNEVMDEIVFDGQQKNAGEEIRLQVNFRIPQHAIHNFNFSNNRLQWLVVIKVGIQSFPDFYEEYALDFGSDAR